MSESKHTPGKWTVRGVQTRDTRDGEAWEIEDQYRRTFICLIGEADARLIAAAPDLLEALQKIVDNVEVPDDLWNSAKAAISKAEGR